MGVLGGRSPPNTPSLSHRHVDSQGTRLLSLSVLRFKVVKNKVPNNLHNRMAHGLLGDYDVKDGRIA